MAREFELVLHSLTQLVTQLVSQCSLFTVHYSLFTVHRSPFTHSLTVTHFVDSFLHFFISSFHRHCHFIFHSSFIFRHFVISSFRHFVISFFVGCLLSWHCRSLSLTVVSSVSGFWFLGFRFLTDERSSFVPSFVPL